MPRLAPIGRADAATGRIDPDLERLGRARTLRDRVNHHWAKAATGPAGQTDAITLLDRKQGPLPHLRAAPDDGRP